MFIAKIFVVDGNFYLIMRSTVNEVFQLRADAAPQSNLGSISLRTISKPEHSVKKRVVFEVIDVSLLTTRDSSREICGLAFVKRFSILNHRIFDIEANPTTRIDVNIVR